MATMPEKRTEAIAQAEMAAEEAWADLEAVLGPERLIDLPEEAKKKMALALLALQGRLGPEDRLTRRASIEAMRAIADGIAGTVQGDPLALFRDRPFPPKVLAEEGDREVAMREEVYPRHGSGMTPAKAKDIAKMNTMASIFRDAAELMAREEPRQEELF